MAFNFVFSLLSITNEEYAKITATGKFDHSQEQLIGPRTAKDNNKYTGMLSIIPHSNVGYHVVTPFQPNDRDYTILVDRGWVHYSKKDPLTRKEGQISDEVTVTGFIRKSEKVSINVAFVVLFKKYFNDDCFFVF